MEATLAPGTARQAAATTATERPDLDRWMAKLLNRHAAVGCAVAVVRDGQPTWYGTHGLADIDGGSPITPDTVFRIASITKTFTAIAVMQLWEEGLVELDAPVNDVLQAYRLIPARGSSKPATVRHLLTHTAGIP